MGPEAGALSLAVDEGSSTTITTTNPQPKKSRLARQSFKSDRVLDESAGQVCLKLALSAACWLLLVSVFSFVRCFSPLLLA